MQHLLLGEHERNEQPAHSSIAIQKRVNRLELDVQEPGPHGEDRLFNELCAVWLLLSAMSVYAVDRYREGVARRKRSETAGPFPEVIRDDEFLFMRMWAWPYVLAALALAALIASRFV